MPTSPGGIRYPSTGGHTDLALYFQQLTEDIDKRVRISVADAAARLALTSPAEGLEVYEKATKRTYVRSATGWDYWGQPTVPDTDWQNLTLASGWTVGTNGARYRVLNGVCYYQVHAVRGTWPADTLVLTLPAGARPPFTHWPSGVWGGLFVSNLVVGADGAVTVSLTEGSGGAGGIVFSGSHPVT